MATVKELRKDILEALEKGEPTEKLERQLQTERLREATAGELDELAAIATRRKELRTHAQVIEGKVERQDAAVGAFLEARAPIIKALEDVRAQAVELQPLQDLCRAEYGAPVDFVREVRDIPQGYLPLSLTLHSLASGVSGVSEQELTAGVLFHIDAALDILRKCQRLERSLPHLLPDSEEV
jgi:hypothetical protein